MLAGFRKVKRRAEFVHRLTALRAKQGKMMAVPLSLLNTSGSPTNLKPTHHMYYGHRLIDVNDDLPKFLKSKGEPWTPESDEARGER